jgi:hypothetical protein
MGCLQRMLACSWPSCLCLPESIAWLRLSRRSARPSCQHAQHALADLLHELDLIPHRNVEGGGDESLQALLAADSHGVQAANAPTGLVRMAGRHRHAARFCRSDPGAHCSPLRSSGHGRFCPGVIAPCIGKVRSIVDGLADNAVPRVDRQHMARNHIVLACGASRSCLDTCWLAAFR